MKEQYGGGYKEFVYEEKEFFEGIENKLKENADQEDWHKKIENNSDDWSIDEATKNENGTFVDRNEFLSSEERQNIVRSMLLNLRAVEGDQVAGVKFHAGQSIGECYMV